MLSLLAKLVGWEGDSFSKDSIDMKEITEELASEIKWEERIHYGRVTEVGVGHSLVDGEFWMAGQSVARISGGEGMEGDRVCVKLGRERGGGGQWRVRELLQVIREGEEWDDDEGGEVSEKEKCLELSGSQPVTKVCCVVVGIRGAGWWLRCLEGRRNCLVRVEFGRKIFNHRREIWCRSA